MHVHLYTSFSSHSRPHRTHCRNLFCLHSTAQKCLVILREDGSPLDVVDEIRTSQSFDVWTIHGACVRIVLCAHISLANIAKMRIKEVLNSKNNWGDTCQNKLAVPKIRSDVEILYPSSPLYLLRECWSSSVEPDSGHRGTSYNDASITVSSTLLANRDNAPGLIGLLRSQLYRGRLLLQETVLDR